jgi:two-component sensor histidine kinase
MSELAKVDFDVAELDRELLQNIVRGMAITADLSRADLLLLHPRSPAAFVVLAQAKPHSIASLYDMDLYGVELVGAPLEVYEEAVRKRRHVHRQHELRPSGAPVSQDVFPIFGGDGQLLALFSIETTLIQLERHGHRHVSFQRAINWLKSMCMRGELARAEHLSPFGEMDGVMLVDAQRRISYVSGIANNLYRRLGYLDDLRGKRLSYLHTGDDAQVAEALRTRRALEQEVEESSYIWTRKVLPVWPPRTVKGWVQGLIAGRRRVDEIGGVLIMVHDATEERRKRQELKVKTTMVQEVHHRVKNNLQTIAAVLRMHARRTENEETLRALNEAIGRILSVAVIHEYLSLDESQTINLRDVCQRIVSQNRRVMVEPDQQIRFSVEGPAIFLPSQQATSSALVVNELIHNALEHGFKRQEAGEIRLLLIDRGERIRLEVWDDGARLPGDFDLSLSSSLGLQIVRSLVQDDLRGVLTIENRDDGVVATVDYPKVALGPGSERVKN